MFFWVFTLAPIFIVISYLHAICFANVLDLFICVIILKTCNVKSSVSFGSHTLLDRLSRVLQLPADTCV